MPMFPNGVIDQVFIDFGSGLVEFGSSIQRGTLYLVAALLIGAIVWAWSESSKRDRDDARKEWEFNR